MKYWDEILVVESSQLTVQVQLYKYPKRAINSIHLDLLKNKDFIIKAPNDKKIRNSSCYDETRSF